MHFARKQPREIQRFLIFIDINNLHDLNNRYGYEEMNRRIRRLLAVPIRSSDCFVGKFFSGDEVLCVTGIHREDAEAIVRKLGESAAANGLSFTCEIGVWNTEEAITEAALKLAEKNLKAKAVRRQSETSSVGSRM